MAELTNPHDRFFKDAMSWPDVTRDFLQYYLPPAVAELLDVSSAELVKDSFVDAELHEHFSDLLCQVSLRAEGGAYVYVLFEHKSYPEPLIAFQLLRYMVQVWRNVLAAAAGAAMADFAGGGVSRASHLAGSAELAGGDSRARGDAGVCARIPILAV